MGRTKSFAEYQDIFVKEIRGTWIHIISISSKEDLTSEKNSLILLDFYNHGIKLDIYIKQSFLNAETEKLIEEQVFDYLALRSDNEISNQFYDELTECLVIEIVKKK